MNTDNRFNKFYVPKQETRWANIDEIKADSLRIPLSATSYPGSGLPIINNGKDAWVDNTDTHSLIFGSTGSKKSRIFCMPMINFMIGAGESFLATDPKGELYDKTSGFAKKNGYKVVVLNYRDFSIGDTWNPLALPYELYHSGYQDDAVARIYDFVHAISQESAEKSKDIFWVSAARSVAFSILMLMLDMCNKQECNLKTFTRFCVEFSKGVEQDMIYARAAGIDEDTIEPNFLEKLMNLAPKDNIARLNYMGIVGSSEKARGDVQSTLFTLIQIFMTQESLVRNMSINSFDLRNMGLEKTAVYLIVPDEKTTYHFIATTFVKQCYETLILEAQKNKNKQLKVRVNFVLDEFANIPTIPDMPSMITAARSRNMRFYLVIQSMNQLTKRYGHDAQTLKGNCENWVFLTSKEIEILEEISKLCGMVRPIKNEEKAWPLISVSQLQRLNKQKGEALIFHCRQYPFITELADIDECNFENISPAIMEKVNINIVESIDPKEMFRKVDDFELHKPFLKKILKFDFN